MMAYVEICEYTDKKLAVNMQNKILQSPRFQEVHIVIAM